MNYEWEGEEYHIQIINQTNKMRNTEYRIQKNTRIQEQYKYENEYQLIPSSAHDKSGI